MNQQLNIAKRVEGVVDEVLIGDLIQRARLVEGIGLLAETKGLDEDINLVASELRELVGLLFYAADWPCSADLFRDIRERRNKLIMLKWHRLGVLLEDPDAHKMWERIAS
jgi:hypothetical protein